MSKEWTLKELAAETGFPERTIRFYISREIVDPPLRAGRGAAYGEKHKAQLAAIRALQAKGMMLEQIRQKMALRRGDPAQWIPRVGAADLGRMADDRSLADLAAAATGPALPSPETWRAYSVADDVVVLLKGESGPWRKRRVLAALRAFAAMIEDGTKKEDRDE